MTDFIIDRDPGDENDFDIWRMLAGKGGDRLYAKGHYFGQLLGSLYGFMDDGLGLTGGSDDGYRGIRRDPIPSLNREEI